MEFLGGLFGYINVRLSCVSRVSYHIEFPVSCPGIFFGVTHLRTKLMKKKIEPSEMEVALPEAISKTGLGHSSY